MNTDENESDEEVANSDSKLWLLVKGCTKPPSNIRAVPRKDRSGKYLEGQKHDTVMMQSMIENDEHSDLHNVLENMRGLKRKTVIDEFKALCRTAVQEGYGTVAVYYTGHGVDGTGDWAFSDGKVSLMNLMNVIAKNSGGYSIALEIISDCCYSGEWPKKVFQDWCFYPNVIIHAACFPNALANDTAQGGSFTLYYTNNSKNDREHLFWCNVESHDGEYCMTYKDRDKELVTDRTSSPF